MAGPIVMPEQAASGAFLSVVDRPSGPALDENSFVTALVCEALFARRSTPEVAAAINAGLDYIESCASRRIPGAFGFWPEGRHPAWLARPLSPDVDDTALCLTVLQLYGRAFLRHNECLAVLQPARCLYLDEGSKPWFEVGVYETWLDQTGGQNPIDLAVNVNVLVLLEKTCQIAAREDAIRAMVHKGLAWAGSRKERFRVLVPWYPEPVEFLFALERAARLGVADLEVHIGALRRQDWVRTDLTSDAVLPLCGSDDGRFNWFCEGLDRLRRLTPESIFMSRVA